MKLFTLQDKIVDFLTSLPNMYDSDAQQAFVSHAGLDLQLQRQISIGKAPLQFTQLLVTTLIAYGTLNDGRHALEVVLETAQKYVGQNKRLYCDVLLQELRANRKAFDSSSTVTSSTSSADLIHSSELSKNRKRSLIFLSYSHNNTPFARTLVSDLEQYGHRVWEAEFEVLIGESLIERIRETIDSADFFMILLSKVSIHSEWVKRELDIAMNRELEEKRIIVLPILLEEVTLPGFLKGKRCADFTVEEHYQENLLLLLRSLNYK